MLISSFKLIYLLLEIFHEIDNVYPEKRHQTIYQQRHQQRHQNKIIGGEPAHSGIELQTTNLIDTF